MRACGVVRLAGMEGMGAGNYARRRYQRDERPTPILKELDMHQELTLPWDMIISSRFLHL